jgi:hypothetical protein
MNKDELIQYASYALWVTLIVILILIINRKAKQRMAAKKALLNPNVLLYPYEFPNAFGEISFFFEADTAIDFTFFLIDTSTNEQITIASGISRVGGQKVPFDTTTLPNGTYYYGIETKYQRIEKKLRITNK